MEQKQKKSMKLQSIGFRIIRIIVLCIAVSTLITVALILPEAKDSLSNSVENNMKDLVRMGSLLVEDMSIRSGSNDLAYADLKQQLSDISVQGVTSSYLYVVDGEGTFIYHKREDKVGTVVFNQYILALLDKIPSGNYQKTDLIRYTDENGVEKYACYYVSEKTGLVSVIVADHDEIVAPITNLRKQTIIFSTLSGLIMLLLGALCYRNISRPINALTAIVSKTSKLDFSETAELDKLAKKKDEIGEMACATKQMQISLRTLVEEIITTSGVLEKNASELGSVSEKINGASTDNSATSEELAASMEETSATVDVIYQNTTMIKDNSISIDEQSRSGAELATAIHERAEKLYRETKQSSSETDQMYLSVKDKTQEALEQSKTIEKIDVLAQTIQNIAEQTSLLALNASIEAARAGEAGKGFSVVATEISKLASQSDTTVKDIMGIVGEVNHAVGNMEDCMNTTLDFLEKKIMVEYQKFLNVSVQYREDALNVKDSMKEIYEIANELEKNTEQITDAISGINDNISEAAQAVNEFAEKTTDIVDMSGSVLDAVAVTNESSEKLKEITERFSL